MPTALNGERTLRAFFTVVNALPLITSATAAQTVARCTPTADSVARPCELDVTVTTTQRSAGPQYPEILRQAGVAGEVHVQYVVDTTGRALVPSLRVLRSTHELFSTAVRNNLPRRRFGLPRRQGIGVRARIEEVISFRHDGGTVYPRFAIPPVAFDVDSTGLLRTTVAAHIIADSLQAPRLTEQDKWAIYAAVTEYFIRHEVTKPSAFCIVANGGDPPPTVLERWRFTDSALVPISRCPPTYARMFRTPGDPIAPPGYQDPVSLDLRVLLPWARDLVVLEVRKSSGMARSEYSCQVSRRSDGWTEVGCYETRASIS